MIKMFNESFAADLAAAVVSNIDINVSLYSYSELRAEFAEAGISLPVIPEGVTVVMGSKPYHYAEGTKIVLSDVDLTWKKPGVDKLCKLFPWLKKRMMIEWAAKAAHELLHVEQHIKGELITYPEQNRAVWLGEEFVFHGMNIFNDVEKAMNYLSAPWEVRARMREALWRSVEMERLGMRLPWWRKSTIRNEYNNITDITALGMKVPYKLRKTLLLK